MLKSICIYCGSSTGAAEAYADAMRQLARKMIDENIALVYGGGKVGLMGILADEMLRLGGEVTGIIPKNLMEKELAHEELTRLYIVRDMHERKAMMADLADGFIAAPGGIGTMEELFETLAWSQLGLHEKPIGIYNVNNYYDCLIELVSHFAKEGFVREKYTESLLIENDPGTLLDRLRTAAAPREKPARTTGRFLI
ncbi:TIGR00730 family Rossman fold protein [Oxalobacter aliiformigenes]|uniref:LOG family protein n=1 Tax=Oxalobacter aliiformigenes TaxID=2946593 RepID=UPI0022B04A47|nr:TIGR00730 family Rossman fold protein [Oxalobacter aliiformigenes]MCZ4063959.1 TIGR00730 family Rossman fold protein [Oxalobacter aliiformigenes]WAV98579.1 TIGR00730 family Rossman fold protein [Oxalobacter aliiformigenes]